MLVHFQGESLLRTEDIVAYLEREGSSIACVCLSGIQYYSGQLFDMKTITEAGQKQVIIMRRSRTKKQKSREYKH